MKTTVELNTTELKVLKALEIQTQECTGGEFSYISDVDKCGLSKNEFAGYISALKAKGMFEYLDTANGDYNGQYALTEDAVKLALESKQEKQKQIVELVEMNSAAQRTFNELLSDYIRAENLLKDLLELAPSISQAAFIGKQNFLNLIEKVDNLVNKSK